MAIVVETGAIVAGAASYVSVEEVKAFIGSIALPAATDAEIERAAVLATRYIDGKYRARLKGQRVKPTIQALEFPRVGVRLVEGGQSYYGVSPSFYDSLYSGFLPIDVIPQEWKDATCELALRALSAPLAADITPSDRITRDKTGPLETEYTARDFTTCYQVVDQLVSRFLRNPNEAVRA